MSASRRPVSPSLTRKRTGGSPSVSPSIFGAAERPNACPDDGLMLPTSATAAPATVAPSTSGAGGGGGRTGGRIPTAPSVSDAPPSVSSQSSPPLLSDEAAVAMDESYGADERALNEFVGLHPMCSMEATSYKTMQLVATMFEKASVRVADVPVIGKAYDDQYLRPPNEQIGERSCACDSQCLCRAMARHRHGPESDLGFVGAEFLLPDERDAFLRGLGLPARRKKCLVCTRYFQVRPTL